MEPPVLKTATRACLAIAASAILMAPAAAAAPSPSSGTTMVLYAENRGITRVDNNAQGPDNGDLVHRELALSRTLKGPVIGVSYSQSEIIAYNPESKIDVRVVDIEDSLPGGWIFYRGVTQLPIGTLPQPGWSATYAIIGGTGKYAEARGVKRLTLLADGVTFKAVITLVK